MGKITKIVTDNDGVNLNSEDLAMRIMDDEGLALIQRYNPDAAKQLPTDHIYKTFPGKSTDLIVKYIIAGDWEKNVNDKPVHNADRALPLPLIAQDLGLPEDATIDTVATHIANQITLATIARFKVELKSVPGTTEAWTALQDKFGADNIALCTTSRKDRMDVSVEHAVNPLTGENARLHEFFPAGPHRLSGYGIEGKNKYDVFFEQNPDFDPAESAIIEDSDSGAGYAKKNRPDTKVIGTVAADFFVDKDAQAAKLFAKGADIVISTMHDLPNAVAWLNDGLDLDKKPDFQGRVYTPSSQDGRTPAPAVPTPSL